MQSIRVRLIIDSVNRQWIIGKMAERLADGLRAYDVDADIGELPADDVHVNHWMLYLQPWRHYYTAPGFFNAGWSPGAAKHTAMITHVDDPLKMQILRETMDKVLDAGICMSRMTMAELVDDRIDAARLTYINPSHDGRVQPRRIVVGITSRLYADGRKREDYLVSVARSMRLDAFHFEIIGEGWDDVASLLREAGAEVFILTNAEYGAILERLQAFDYYLYMGWDEGSMGTLDALAAGVKTIVTPQGFHLDLPGGITHPFHDADELRDVFASIAADRQSRLDSVRHLTWAEYARKHALVWRTLLEGGDVSQLELEPKSPYEVTATDIAAARRRRTRRIAKSEFWTYFVESRKFWVRGKLSRMKRFLRARPR